ncbi:hypothetical protein A2U01_0087955, partial [Trifolium medium]|nr:hypothetical protein [Trifolium medium]
TFPSSWREAARNSESSLPVARTRLATAQESYTFARARCKARSATAYFMRVQLGQFNT